MVFFVCEGCNESLKKNQVDKHAMKCAGCWAVTCVDCSVTFPDNEYATHTSCVSEAQKYEGSLYKGKKEKLNAQDKWGLVLEYALEHVNDAPVSIRTYIPDVCQSGNVPRQQKKFNNFVKNSIRLHSPPLLDELWAFLEKCKDICWATPDSSNPPPMDKITAHTETTNDSVKIHLEDKQDQHKEIKKKKKKEKEKHALGNESEENFKMVTEKKKSKKKKNIENGSFSAGAVSDKMKKKKKKRSQDQESAIEDSMSKKPKL